MPNPKSPYTAQSRHQLPLGVATPGESTHPAVPAEPANANPGQLSYDPDTETVRVYKESTGWSDVGSGGGGGTITEVTGSEGVQITDGTGPTVNVGLTPGAEVGQVLTWDGAVYIPQTLPAATSLTGNPYIDNLGTPGSIDDEFDSGSADLATRGWTVYDRSTGLTATRIGSIDALSPPPGPGQYRSTLYGSRLIVQTDDHGLVISKAAALSLSMSYMLRVGAPYGRGLTNGGNSPSTVLSGDLQVGFIRSTVAPGSTPFRTGNNYQYAYFGQAVGAQSYYGYEEFTYSFTRNPTDQYSSSIINWTDGLWMYINSSGKLEDLALINASDGSVRAKQQHNNGGEISLSGTGQIAFALWNNNNQSHTGPINTFSIDYIRERTGASWYGL